MQEYHSPADLEQLTSEDPGLWREIYGYMQVCLYEDDEADLSFRVASEEDLPEVQALGIPEETATITCQGHTRTIQRVIPDRYRQHIWLVLVLISAVPPTGREMHGWSG